MNQQQHTGSEHSAGSPGERTRAVGRPARAPRDQEAPYSATDEGSQDRCTGTAHRMLGAIAPRCQTSASGGRPARRRRRAAGPCGAAWRLSPASRPARQQGTRLGGGAGRARAHRGAAPGSRGQQGSHVDALADLQAQAQRLRPVLADVREAQHGEPGDLQVPRVVGPRQHGMHPHDGRPDAGPRLEGKNCHAHVARAASSL